jgi:transposase
VNSKKQGIDLVGPVPSHKSWQSRSEEAFDHTAFVIDWAGGTARCPGGKTSAHYSERKTWRGTPNVMFAFRAEDCQRCPLRERCSRAENIGRTLTVYPPAEYAAQEQARQRQATAEYQKLYQQRAGIEGTISAAVRGEDVRHARYIGLARRPRPSMPNGSWLG